MDTSAITGYFTK